MDKSILCFKTERIPRRSSITQYGITWTFDKPYRSGQYITGDWWVLDEGSGVTVTGINPSPVYHATNGYNGSMINPPCGQYHANKQAWDSRNSYLQYDYDSSYGFVPGDNLEAGDSLVSTISLQESDLPYTDVGGESQDTLSGADGATVKDAAVLTCVGSIPAPNSFRPSYATGTKIIKTSDEINWTPILAQTITPVSGQPSLSSMARYVERPWISATGGWSGDIIRPVANIPNYGMYVSHACGAASWALMCNYTQDQKTPILYGLLQVGIDLRACWGAGTRWVPDGGEGGGCKFPQVFAGYIFEDSTFYETHDVNDFGETGQTFYVSQNDIDDRDYIQDDLGIAEWGREHSRNTGYDTRSWDAAYRRTNTAITWWTEAIVMRILGIESLWNHDAFFDYMDRYNSLEPFANWQHHWGDWVGNIITTYWGTYD